MSVPDFSGTGYLAGEAPDGLTTVVAVPVPATVQVLWRDPETDEEHLVASTASAPDGTWRITGLNHELEYVVRGIKDGWNDVTVVGAVPTRMDLVTATGVLETNEDGNGVAGSMLIEGGLPPYTVSVIDPLPYGLEPVLDYRTLTIAGTSDDWGRWRAAVRVTASNAVFVDVPVTVDINSAWTPEHLSVAPKIWLDHDSSVTDVSGVVSAWANRGSLGSQFQQSTAASRPSAQEGLNGERFLRFDSNDYLDAPSALLGAFKNAGHAWVFAVARRLTPDSADVEHPILVASVPGGSGYMVGMNVGNLLSGGANKMWYGGRRISSDAYGGVSTPTSVVGDWVLSFGATDYGSRTADLCINGKAVASASGMFGSSGSTANSDSLRLRVAGNAVTPTTAFFVGDIAAILAGVDDISRSEQQRIEGYYAHSYGLIGSLPVDHPFRAAAPYAATPALQQSVGSGPVVLGFVAAGGPDVGAATGPAVDPLGTWFNGGPDLGAGEGVSVMSDGDDITVTLTNITPPTTPAQAVLLDHKGMSIVTIPLTASGGDYSGSAPGALDDGEVYYLRIEAA